MLTDATWVACIAGDVMGIPVGSLWNFLFTNYNRTTLTLPEEYPLRKTLGRLGGDRLIRLFEKARIAQTILGILLLVWVIPFNIVRVKYMLKERKWIGLKRNMFSQVGGVLNLFPDYVAFGGMKINHRALAVGPIVWEPAATGTSTPAEGDFKAFLERDKDKALIYVTMGSTGELRLFKLIIEALKDKDYRVAITTGAQCGLSRARRITCKYVRNWPVPWHRHMQARESCDQSWGFRICEPSHTKQNTPGLYSYLCGPTMD